MTALITGVGQVAIVVRDLPRATAFYRDILGLAFLFDAGHMSFFDCGGLRLMLTTLDQSESTYASTLYFNTENIQAAVDQLTGRGVVFQGKPRMIAKMPDHELWMAFFNDSEGNVMALMTEVR